MSAINPGKLITILDLTDDEQDALNELVLQWRAKRTRNNLRSAFYDMKNSERSLMSAQVPNVVRRRRFVLGWSAIAVDKLNRRCNLDGFYDAGGVDLNSLGLADLQRENRLTAELSQGGVSSLIHAVSWLVTTQGDVDAGEPEVLINARSAATATGIWNPRRRAITSFLSINALDDKGEPTAMTMYLHNLNVIMVKENGAWSVDRRDHTYGVPVDPMRYKPRVERPYGSSRITRSVMSLHIQALAAMIRADVNGEAYSLPRYVLLGATEEAFKNADGSPKSTWEAAWDAVWAVGDDEDATNPRADVKQFTGSSPEPQNAHLRMLAQMMSGETGIPIGEFGLIGDANPTSAEALQVSRDDLIAEAEQTTDNWSPDISSAVTRALRMLNRSDIPENLDVRGIWRNPMHVSRAAAADAGTKTIDKIPWLADTEVGMELMGLSTEQIRRALAERRRGQGRSVLEALRAASGPDATE
ncbi:MAG TPA: phage portal protein [Aeromicrobium sp.]|nr:phage portal protein [Aeromicrobium sp.]HKY57671.1 phage portal protein [Aeromicrobium sp.]